MTYIFVVLWNLLTYLQRELYIHLNSENVYICSATCFLLDINVFGLWYPKCTGGSCALNGFSFEEPAWRPSLVTGRRLVQRYLSLGPRGYPCLGQCLRGTCGWRSEFLCSEMPPGNSGEWRTIYFKGVWLLPLLEKNSIYSIPVFLKVDTLKVIS